MVNIQQLWVGETIDLDMVLRAYAIPHQPPARPLVLGAIVCSIEVQSDLT